MIREGNPMPKPLAVLRRFPVNAALPCTSHLLPAPLILLDSFVAQEEHYDGREYATRNVHLMSKGRSMTPPPQIQPR
jgi:hypothetical protein